MEGDELEKVAVLALSYLPTVLSTDLLLTSLTTFLLLTTYCLLLIELYHLLPSLTTTRKGRSTRT